MTASCHTRKETYSLTEGPGHLRHLSRIIREASCVGERLLGFHWRRVNPQHRTALHRPHPGKGGSLRSRFGTKVPPPSGNDSGILQNLCFAKCEFPFSLSSCRKLERKADHCESKNLFYRGDCTWRDHMTSSRHLNSVSALCSLLNGLEQDVGYGIHLHPWAQDECMSVSI